MAIKGDKKIQVAEYEKAFSDEINRSDTEYVDTLKRLKNIRESREKHQKLQLKRLLKKYGSSAPRVLKLLERVSKEQEMKSFVNVSIDNTTIDKEAINDSYILRGKVRGDSAKGLSGYIVQLQDAKNNVISKPVTTDINGNYSIVIDINEGEPTPKLNIAVLNAENTLVKTDKLPVVVKADTVEARDVLISSVDVKDRSIDTVILNSLSDTLSVDKTSVVKVTESPLEKKTGKNNKKIVRSKTKINDNKEKIVKEKTVRKKTGIRSASKASSKSKSSTKKPK